ncbi:MAG: hypothetical protein ABSA47_03345 [Verrucomicrobiota bacterium]
MRYLGIRRLLWMLALVATLAFCGSFALVEYVFQIQDEDSFGLIWAGLFLGFWALGELSVAIYLRRNKVLERTPNA